MKPKTDPNLLRSSLGLTWEEFAHALGVSLRTVARWSSGESKPGNLANMALERLLEYPPANAINRNQD